MVLSSVIEIPLSLALFSEESGLCPGYQYEAVEATEKTDASDVGDGEECGQRDDAEGD